MLGIISYSTECISIGWYEFCAARTDEAVVFPVELVEDGVQDERDVIFTADRKLVVVRAIASGGASEHDVVSIHVSVRG